MRIQSIVPSLMLIHCSLKQKSIFRMQNSSIVQQKMWRVRVKHMVWTKEKIWLSVLMEPSAFIILPQ